MARVVLACVALVVIGCTLFLAGRPLGFTPRSTLVSITVMASMCLVFMRDWVVIPVTSKSGVSSDKIWSITLQNPSQVIRRVVPYPNIGSATAVRIRVALDGDYHGSSFLMATVNGGDFGRMFPEGTQRGLSLGHDSLELIFDASALDELDFVEVDLRQAIPDPALRIVVVGQARGAILGESSAFFGDGFRWLRGVPVAKNGMIASGLPQIWLDGVY